MPTFRRTLAATVAAIAGALLLVLDSARRGGREWLKVRLPVRPNGVSGWILRSKALVGHAPYWLDLRLRDRRLTVYRHGKRIRSVRAVIGAPRTPTPRGLAAIYERNRQPHPGGFLGPWALSLTALSNVLESYGGGPGRVAIHAAAAQACAIRWAARARTVASGSATGLSTGSRGARRRARRCISTADGGAPVHIHR